ncbi:MAG: PilC/PilY family type IV pilus protein [Gammaproteobacteria bacterium]
MLHRFCTASLALLVAAPAAAGGAPPSQVPLFVRQGVAPNVFFEVDDSGSMDFSVLTRPYWHRCAYDPAAHAPGRAPDDDCGYRVTNGLFRDMTRQGWRNLYYVFKNPDDAYSTDCRAGRASLEGCDETPDWRVRNARVNVLYYNPAVKYRAWPGPCDTQGTPCRDADFTHAYSNPFSGTPGHAESSARSLAGFSYEVWRDDRGFEGSRPQRGTQVNATAHPNGVVDLWDSHYRFTVFADRIVEEKITYAPDEHGLHPTVSRVRNYHPDAREITRIQQNIANWYSYYRRRSLAAKAALARVVATRREVRFGLSLINAAGNLFITMPEGKTGPYDDHDDHLLRGLFGYRWRAQGTPLRRGLNRVGRYFAHKLDKPSPIKAACQKNFAVLLTDGYWNGDSPAVGDADLDGIPDTLADVARYYYMHDLSPLADRVPPDDRDAAAYQHLDTFTVAFGVHGRLHDKDGDGWPDPALAPADHWGDPVSGADSPAQIDDLWHAARNSHGGFVSAATPDAVSRALQKALQSVADRSSSAASVSLNSGVATHHSRLFQARFDSSDWSGQLLAFNLDPDDGGLKGIAWDAADQLPPPARRVMITSTGHTAVPLRWAALPAELRLRLDTDGRGRQRLAWLRGSQADETDGGGPFRTRHRLLGDIVHSAPVYVGRPPAGVPATLGGSTPAQSHAAFRAAERNRAPMIYAGGNDGMLHAFDARTGRERLAYVPHAVWSHLAELSDPHYAHRYFVDGPPSIADAWFANAWHTVLAGGLGAGGQGIYALDVTHPAAFAEAHADSTFLWEFTDRDDADLGYTFSPPQIVRLHDGHWAAIFGNGFGSSVADGHGSATGRAVLFIVNLADGQVLRKIDTGVGTPTRPNGLGPVFAVDHDGDYVTDAVYAGDLAGNLWKFDLHASTPAAWDVAGHHGDRPAQPLFTATGPGGHRQPITSRPVVGDGPRPGTLMVYFGTGRYFTPADPADTSVQTLYGIIDEGHSVDGRDELLHQTFRLEGGRDFGEGANRIRRKVRVVSDRRLDPATRRGWYLDLDRDPGERITANPALRNGRLIVPTLIPSAAPCAAGGSGWLLELDALNGGSLERPPFDLNGDDRFDSGDNTGADHGRIVSGIQPHGGGIPTAPAVLVSADDRTAGAEIKLISTSKGAVDAESENPGRGSVGRQSWEQIR